MNLRIDHKGSSYLFESLGLLMLEVADEIFGIPNIIILKFN